MADKNRCAAVPENECSLEDAGFIYASAKQGEPTGGLRDVGRGKFHPVQQCVDCGKVRVVWNQIVRLQCSIGKVDN